MGDIVWFSTFSDWLSENKFSWRIIIAKGSFIFTVAKTFLD